MIPPAFLLNIPKFYFPSALSFPSSRQCPKAPKVNNKTAKPLIDWFNSHISFPYPNCYEIETLKKLTGFTNTQLGDWFRNHRRNYKKKINGKIPWERPSLSESMTKIFTDSDISQTNSESRSSSISPRKDPSSPCKETISPCPSPIVPTSPSKYNKKNFTAVVNPSTSVGKTYPSFPMAYNNAISHQLQIQSKIIHLLENWFAAHLSFPFPNEQEIQKLKQLSGLNQAQLDQWFSHRRFYFMEQNKGKAPWLMPSRNIFKRKRNAFENDSSDNSSADSSSSLSPSSDILSSVENFDSSEKQRSFVSAAKKESKGKTSNKNSVSPPSQKRKKFDVIVIE